MTGSWIDRERRQDARGTDEGTLAVALYLRALRTSEETVVERLRPLMAPGVSVTGGFAVQPSEALGVDAVCRRLRLVQPGAPVYRGASYSEPARRGNEVVVTAAFPGLGAAPAAATFRFTFDARGQLSGVQEQVDGPPMLRAGGLPDDVRAAIDGALANGTPMVMSYVDDDGTPSLSVRGSIQTLGAATLGLWARPGSGFARRRTWPAPVALLYRNSASRTTILVKGRAIPADAAQAEVVYSLMPEVERTHDPDRRGAAFVIEVAEASGTTPSGILRIDPSRQASETAS